VIQEVTVKHAYFSLLAVVCVFALLMSGGKGFGQPSQAQLITPSVVGVYPVDTKDREKPAWVLLSDGGIIVCQFKTLVTSDTAIECGPSILLNPRPKSIHPVPSLHRNKAAWVTDTRGDIRACEFTKDTLTKNAPVCSQPKFGASP
jgi:hypothetical protein